MILLDSSGESYILIYFTHPKLSMTSPAILQGFGQDLDPGLLIIVEPRRSVASLRSFGDRKKNLLGSPVVLPIFTVSQFINPPNIT